MEDPKTSTLETQVTVTPSVPTEEQFRDTLNSVLELVQNYKDDSLKCPVTKNRAVAICLNPRAPRQVLCTTCLVKDAEFVRSFRTDILPIEELKSKLVDGIQTFVKTEKNSVVENIQKLKEKLKSELVQVVSEEFETRIDEKLKSFFDKFHQNTPPIESEPTGANETPEVQEESESEEDEEAYEDVSGSDSDDAPPVPAKKAKAVKEVSAPVVQRKNWTLESKEAISKAIKDNQDPEVLLSIYKRISQDSTVRAKLFTSELLSSNDKSIEESKVQIRTSVDNLVDIFSMKLSSTLNDFPPMRKDYVLRRFNSSSQPYNYTNTMNSLLFMVSQPSVFYGYSQYITTSPNIPVDFQILRGIRARDKGHVLLKMKTEIKNEQDPSLATLQKVEGITSRSYPVIFNTPLVLEANVWYHISFNKPDGSHYIVYGSSPLHANGERYPFSGNAKQISFRKAEDDTIDNGPSIGQFPDFYLQ